MAVYEFKSNFDKSNNDANIVMEYFTTLGYECIDYSKDKEKQINEGIDFGIRKNNPEYQSVEFKSCQRVNKTGNIAFEIISNFLGKRLGSCITSQAKYLFYYDNKGHILHTMDLQKLSNVIKNDQKPKWEVAKASTPIKSDTYCSFSLLIPVKYLLQHKEEISYNSYDLSIFLLDRLPVSY